MSQFLSGVIATGYLLAGLFFLRFWRRTADRLFMFFAIAFSLFALTQTLTALSAVPREEHSWFYLLRLAGFCVIIVAIVVKNLQARGGPPRTS